ncbi:uncharacterized protein Z518_09849 [Rhinocladiella mackenziei CBS 650.93]|uniref:Transcriptional coactivator p15 (PC4) C-terminal domain-containing protein n=1 Tax=Rhinocladiella mackenziei CBS 650.93 TaxID=1442369 RepID=A0A0D2I4P6_9EURO|nr:uncharacterized protein Z518_09849 [Rhinocladiella mackenziei CBS 650.93]KIX00784.1 hypothetical protein Z518_09849 [Rhinocladiella mackenziei CBS 650.93]
MSFTSKKRKSSEIVHNDGDINGGTVTKRGKGKSGTVFKPSSKVQSDSEGNQFWEISKNRRVTISDFKGAKLVNIREYYQQDNKWLPGKKGISMSIEQYSALIDIMPQIEDVLKQKGEKVPRPNYRGRAPDEDDQNGEEEDDEEMDYKKANIEATSDEEE